MSRLLNELSQKTANEHLKERFRRLLTADAVDPGRVAPGGAAPDRAAPGRVAPDRVASDRVASEDMVQLQFVPGRIEVFGKHTDYAGGESLTCASQHGIAAFVQRHDAPSLVIDDYARSTTIELTYDDPVAAPSWSLYPAAVLKRMIRHFGVPRRGVRLGIHSDLPGASGMSSSSSLIISVILALLQDEGYESARSILNSPVELAGFAGALESGADYGPFSGDQGVGTKGGSQDHTAILMSSAGELGLYSYEPIDKLSAIKLPEDVIFVVGTSGVKARKTGQAKERYNAASLAAREVARMYSEDVGESYSNLGSMMASPNFDRDGLRHCIQDELLWNRFSQYERECALVIPRAMEALARRDWATFGAMSDESQRMAAELLGNQVPETVDLARIAREAGALGASSFGAGFGGAVWALIARDDSKRFLSHWRTSYLESYPQHAGKSRFFRDSPGEGAWTVKS